MSNFHSSLPLANSDCLPQQFFMKNAYHCNNLEQTINILLKVYECNIKNIQS